MSREYTVSKTVRFKPATYELVKVAAFEAGISTSQYIREAALDALPWGGDDS